MFDIGGPEFLALAVLALLVFGPDKLPKYAAEAARFLRQVRAMANSAREDVRRELGPELGDLDLDDLNPRNLHPRSLVRRHVLDDLDGERPTPAPTPDPPRQQAPGEPTGAVPPPYDPDAT